MCAPQWGCPLFGPSVILSWLRVSPLLCRSAACPALPVLGDLPDRPWQTSVREAVFCRGCRTFLWLPCHWWAWCPRLGDRVMCKLTQTLPSLRAGVSCRRRALRVFSHQALVGSWVSGGMATLAYAQVSSLQTAVAIAPGCRRPWGLVSTAAHCNIQA